MVPEIEQLEPVVLTGEIPDPTRIPAGCRFHPRCPALADGAAARAPASPDAVPRAPAAATVAARRTRTGTTCACHLVACRRDRSTPRRGDGDLQAALPREMYVDDAAWARERERVLFGEWTCVGRVDDLGLDAARRGWPSSTSLGESVLVTSDEDGALHAAYNVCRHRGSQLFPTEPGSRAGRAPRRALRCPYHSWTYALDGSLLRAPHTEDVDVDPADFSLHPVGVETWARVRLRAPDARRRGAAAPTASAQRRRRRWPTTTWATLVTGQTLTYDVAANWKVVAENYNECYHCGPVHPELVPAGAGVRRRRRRTSTGTTASRTARAPGRSR